jgi:hypothetical protein
MQLNVKNVYSEFYIVFINTVYINTFLTVMDLIALYKSDGFHTRFRQIREYYAT